MTRAQTGGPKAAVQNYLYISNKRRVKGVGEEEKKRRENQQLEKETAGRTQRLLWEVLRKRKTMVVETIGTVAPGKDPSQEEAKCD